MKCRTSLVAEIPETRQHFFYFFTFFLLRPRCSSAGKAILKVLLRKTREGCRQYRSSCAGLRREVERSPRPLPTRWRLRRLAGQYSRLWRLIAILFREADPPLAVSRYVVIFQIGRVAATAPCRRAYATSELPRHGEAATTKSPHSPLTASGEDTGWGGAWATEWVLA